MIKQRCISIESGDEWDEALSGIKHSFSHTRENCLAMKFTTGNDTSLYCFEKENVKIICPVSERKFEGYTDIVTPYGFSGFAGNEDCIEFTEHWNEFVRRKNYVCGYLSQNPLFQNNTYFKKEDSYRSTNLYFIDLDQGLTELFENLDANRKKQIKNYKKAEAKFIYDKELLKKFFMDNYYDFLKRINASKANYFSKETLEYICTLGNVFMVGAGTTEKIEAVYIFGYTEYAGDCLFNVATSEGREYSPLLLWCGLKFLKKRKIPVMNLGGGIKEDDSVALSKERFGASKLPFMNLKQIYDRNVYDKLCKGKNADADDMNGYFPAYRK